MGLLSKKIISLKAELISGNIRYAGFTGNIAEDSIYMIMSPTNTPINFTPGTSLGLKLEPSPGEIVFLNCRITWSYKTPPHGLTNSIGIEIIDSSVEYKNLLKALE